MCYIAISKMLLCVVQSIFSAILFFCFRNCNLVRLRILLFITPFVYFYSFFIVILFTVVGPVLIFCFIYVAFLRVV